MMYRLNKTGPTQLLEKQCSPVVPAGVLVTAFVAGEATLVNVDRCSDFSNIRLNMQNENRYRDTATSQLQGVASIAREDIALLGRCPDELVVAGTKAGSPETAGSLAPCRARLTSPFIAIWLKTMRLKKHASSA